jgi:hypothetical protein
MLYELFNTLDGNRVWVSTMHIAYVEPHGSGCAVVMVNGYKIAVAMPVQMLAQRLGLQIRT